MAYPEDRKSSRIQMKYLFIALIAIVSTLLLIASIVLIAIGYQNPFGTIGLGILGGGCILYFFTLLLFCMSCIWVKNNYYKDETDFGEKQVGAYIEDTSLLKEASNLTSLAQPEEGCLKERGENNPVPLYSVSTVYSSISSASTVPEKGMLYNFQVDDATEGAEDLDVFTSSPTAMQYTHMKSQENLQLHRGSIDVINCDSTGWNKIDMKKRHIEEQALRHNNGKFLPDVPRQRNPVVINTLEAITPGRSFVPHGNGDNISAKTQICGAIKLPDVPGPAKKVPILAAPPKHDQHLADRSKPKVTNRLQMLMNSSQECEPTLENLSAHIGGKDIQISKANRFLIGEDDSSKQIATKGHKQTFHGVTSKGLYTVQAANLGIDKKHKSCEKLDKPSQDRTAISLQYLLPKSQLEQSAQVPLSNQMIRANDTNREIKVMKKQAKPGTRMDY